MALYLTLAEPLRVANVLIKDRMGLPSNDLILESLESLILSILPL